MGIPIFSSSRTYNFCAVHTPCDLHPHLLSNTAIARTDQRFTAKMRSSIMIVAPFVAAAYAQSSAPANGTEGAMTSSSSYSYSNDATQYLTQTDSRGVITGQPAAATSQPQVATVPAALPTGIQTIAYGNESSFLVSVGSSTTSIIGGNGVQTDASVVEGTTGGVASATTLTTSSSDSDASETSGSSGSSSTSSSDSDSNDSDSNSSSSASSTSEDSSASGTASSSAADSSSSDSGAS